MDTLVRESPTEFSDWLYDRYVEWTKENRKNRTAGKFARWLGIHPATLSGWLNGTRKLSLTNAQLIAPKLGYGVLEYALSEFVDVELRRVIVSWNQIEPNQKKQFADQISRAAEGK